MTSLKVTECETILPRVRRLKLHLHEMFDGGVSDELAVVQLQLPQLGLSRVTATQVAQPLVTDSFTVAQGLRGGERCSVATYLL